MATSSDARTTLKGLLFVSPWLIGFCAFTALPVILSLYYSFCDYSLLQPPLWRGMENYNTLMHDAVFWQSLFNTLYYAVFALPVGLIIALALAMLLNTKIAGQSIYRTIIYLPSLVPAVASAMIWLWLYNTKLGLINALLRPVLHLVGINKEPPWLDDVHWAMPSLILMSFWGVGNTVIIYLAGLQDVPRELYEAAELDGCSKWQQTINVTLPMISPVIFFNLIMGIIGTLQTFTLPEIMTQGGPQRSTYFFTMYLYDNAFHYLKMGYASALAWIQLLLVLLLTGIAFWTSKRWVHYQGK